MVENSMESEIVNYAKKISPIMRRLLEDSNFYNTAVHSYVQDLLREQISLRPGKKPEPPLAGFPEFCIAITGSVAQIKARQKEIADVVPPEEAKSHHSKLLSACQKKEQALDEYLTYTDQFIKHGVMESTHLQQANELMKENSQLLAEANTELVQLYTKADIR
jgi:hypothetical protein